MRNVTYAELKSGSVEINGEDVRVSPLSSYRMSKKIAVELKKMIEKSEFFLSMPVERIPVKESFRSMKQKEIKVVKSVMTSPAITVSPETTIANASRLLIENEINHLPVVDSAGKLVGIVTSWDIARAVAMKRVETVGDIMTRKVITAFPDDPIEIAARKMDVSNISALPVVDSKGHVVGIVSSEDLSKLLAR